MQTRNAAQCTLVRKQQSQQWETTKSAMGNNKVSNGKQQNQQREATKSAIGNNKVSNGKQQSQQWEATKSAMGSNRVRNVQGSPGVPVASWILAKDSPKCCTRSMLAALALSLCFRFHSSCKSSATVSAGSCDKDTALHMLQAQSTGFVLVLQIPLIL